MVQFLYLPLANSSYKETLERLLTRLADLNLTNSLQKERVQTGSGGFEDVYQGTLTNGEKVVIKCYRAPPSIE